MAKSEVVLGIHDGHNSSACLLVDGRVVAAIAEERMTRLKNEAGFPEHAVDEVLRLAGCAPADVDVIALGTRMMHHREFFQSWDWYRKGYADQVKESAQEEGRKRKLLDERLRQRYADIARHLPAARDRITLVEHHEAHAATAYYGSSWSGTSGRTLVLTLDGSGDGICSTVSVGEAGRLTRIAETKSAASIGKLYSRITFLLGMKPWEHEYKVMGLAPYADAAGVERSRQVISQLVLIDDGALVFRNGTHLSTNYCYSYVRDQLENHRFDWIAGAVQKITEDLVVKWVRNAVAHTGIRRVACAGGVFMNVKVNMLLRELAEVEDLFVFPSCGDESIPFGAAYLARMERREGAGEAAPLQGIDSAYLGTTYTQGEIDNAVEAANLAGQYTVERPADINTAVARVLASGGIVARFDGAMEWGARALGNRSILMDPTNVSGVRELNTAIKHRAFWMPFAPTILEEHQGQYLKNPTGQVSPYMLLAFRTTDLGARQLPAAIHPYDQTARPQILARAANPSYYDLVSKFGALTGVHAVLNTSFNLHGEPIVRSPEDAISVFERSGLQWLCLGSLLISKQPAPLPV